MFLNMWFWQTRTPQSTLLNIDVEAALFSIYITFIVWPYRRIYHRIKQIKFQVKLSTRYCRLLDLKFVIHRLEMWRWSCFLVSASCVTISNLHPLSSSETGVNPGIRSWKKHLFEWARCQKAAIGGIYIATKWRAETLQRSLEFDNFKPRHERGIFKWICRLNDSFFEGDDRGILKGGVKTYLMAPTSPLNSPTIFLSSHL
jgi:hypothetical protein